MKKRKRDTEIAVAFPRWLNQLKDALRSDEDMDVPCGECTACCTSSYFIHIAPHESEALSRIPKALQFDAPGLKTGHVLLGYKADGSCAMFENGGCTIYDARRQTCRNFDCRILAVAGLLESADRPAINDRIVQWVFAHPDSGAN